MVLRIFRRGLVNGLKTTLELAKAIIPAYFLITFLKYTAAFETVSKWCAGFMGYFGLPGEASLPLVIGNAISLYPAFGAVQALGMTGKQVTIIALMLVFSHDLFVELAVTHKTEVKIFPILFFRLGLAVASALLLNTIL